MSQTAPTLTQPGSHGEGHAGESPTTRSDGQASRVGKGVLKKGGGFKGEGGREGDKGEKNSSKANLRENCRAKEN